MKIHKKTILAVLSVCLLLPGCKRGPDAAMRGEYVNDGATKATLKVSADTMVVSGGPLVITATYKVLEVTEDTVTVELSAPNKPKVTMVVQVLADSLVVKDNFIFGGTWKRR